MRLGEHLEGGLAKPVVRATSNDVGKERQQNDDCYRHAEQPQNTSPGHGHLHTIVFLV
jgi:hypothetical protein